jgi:Mor family transcriptional regulator
MMDKQENETFDQLQELIGTDAAQQVAESFAGTSLYIPKGIVTAEQHKAIRQEFKDGATYRELARRYGYAERYVRAIIHRKLKTKP